MAKLTNSRLQQDYESQKPLVWLVVLNWNRPADTLTCIESLKKQDYPTFRILVVDNGSTDDSIAQFQALSNVAVLDNRQNLGFAAGNNRGITYVLDQGADYVFLLNNDTFVSPTMLSSLVDIAERDSLIGIVGPMIYYADEPTRVWFAGMTFKHGLYVVRQGLHLKQPLKDVEEVDFISGCGMLVRRAVWEQVGKFDERFFMYYEDLDFSIRTKKVGYRLVCATQAKMWHALSASTGGADSPLKQYYQIKSTFLFCKKHTYGIMYILNIGIRLAHAMVIAIKNTFRGKLFFDTIKLYILGIREAFNI